MSRIQIWGELVVGSQNNTLYETNGVNTTVLRDPINRQYSSVLPLLRHFCQFLTKFVERHYGNVFCIYYHLGNTNSNYEYAT